MPGSPEDAFTFLGEERLKELVAEHVPVLHMHQRDKFMPCSAEWFMQRSELWLHQPQGNQQGAAPSGSRCLLGYGEVTETKLAQMQRRYPTHELQLRLNPLAKQGPPPEAVNDVPIYANVKLVTTGDVAHTLPEAIEINYITFYAHNGWYDIGYVGLIKVGAHDGDWEHFTVRLSLDGTLQGVWFNAHRPRDGCWVPAHKLDRTSQGRLKVYVALHGHGTYPKPGMWWRAGMMANDRTSTRGVTWTPRTCCIMPKPSLAQKGHQNQDLGVTQNAELTEDDVSEMQPLTAGDIDLRTPWTGKQPLRLDTPLHEVSSRQLDLIRTPSRGSLLPRARRQLQKSSSGEGVRAVVQKCEWLQFLGKWGTIESPSAQSWFWVAETPVSRHWFLRIFCQLWPETHKVSTSPRHCCC